MTPWRKRRPVVLYQPRDEGVTMPLGLLAVASALVDEHVVIVDGRFELAPEARVVELASDACLLGVSGRTGVPLRDALRVSAAARTANPGLRIVWGGPHATWAPGSCLERGVVDACVRGAGEDALAAAVACARAGERLEKVPGLVLPGGIVTRPLPPPAAERVPHAVYSLLDVERHFEARGGRRLDYCSSRGARGDAHGWTGFSPERVLAELGELGERYRLAEVLFQDEDFFADPERVSAIAAGLADAGRHFSWQAFARVADVLRLGDAGLRALAASGCRKLHLALPPGTAVERRKETLEAAACLHARGLAARFEIQVDEPGPRAAALGAAVALARALSALDGHFETPLSRLAAVPPSVHAAGDASLEQWAATAAVPWPDARAERRLGRAAFFVREAQRPPGRRVGQHLLRLCSLLRVRLGLFGLDVERWVVEASAVLRTGRARAVPRPD